MLYHVVLFSFNSLKIAVRVTICAIQGMVTRSAPLAGPGTTALSLNQMSPISIILTAHQEDVVQAPALNRTVVVLQVDLLNLSDRRLGGVAVRVATFNL